jgi:hypothetical protein
LEPTGSGGDLGRALDVRLREILPFVEKRSAADLGLSVDETVPEAPSLAVASEGFERDQGGFRLDRLNGDAGGSQKVSDVRFRFRDGSSPLPRQTKHGFVNRDRGRFGAIGGRQRRHKRVGVWLARKHRDDCGSVYDDHRSPLRSS